jgi:predicted GIY-YIG superfamily endonuclease
MELLIILTFILAFGAGIIIGYFVKRKINQQINNNIAKAEMDILNNYHEKIENAKEKWENLKKQTEEATLAFNNLTASMKEAQERELKICYENGLEEIKRKLLKADSELNANYQENRLKYSKEINEIKSELDLFKAARRAIIDDQKRQEEMETNRNFYMLQIGQYDKMDIEQLRLIEPKLHNKEVLNKLIWSTYYQVPYKDLIGRIFGTRKVSGIYKITCVENNKTYIGKSVDVANRWSEHIKSSLEIGTIAKNQLYTLMKEKGAENFTFELLEEVNKDKLLERESYWIKFYETDSYGLNMKG